MDNRINVVPYDASLQKLASSFHSGNSYLDRFLIDPISLDDSFGKTFVFLSSDDQTIIGYYNLGVGYLDERFHGLLQAYTEDGVKVNLSDILLDHCLEKIEVIRKEYVGFSFVTLNSTREGYSLYLRNGFEELEEDMHFAVEDSDVECIPMYLIMDLEI